MSKSIKVSEDVYQNLLDLQRPRETFSETIARLLMIYVMTEKVMPFVRQQQEYFERQVERVNEAKAALSRGDSPEVPNVRSG